MILTRTRCAFEDILERISYDLRIISYDLLQLNKPFIATIYSHISQGDIGLYISIFTIIYYSHGFFLSMDTVMYTVCFSIDCCIFYMKVYAIGDLRVIDSLRDIYCFKKDYCILYIKLYAIGDIIVIDSLRNICMVITIKNATCAVR